MISKLELAYLAGYFDGEGCICIWRRHERGGRMGLDVAVESCSPHAISRFIRAFGGQARHAAGRNKSRPSIRWRLFGRTALPCLLALYPHLREKKEQCRLAIRFLDLEPHDIHKEEIWAQVKALKKLVFRKHKKHKHTHEKNTVN